MRASQGRRSCEELEDGLPDGRHARLRGRTCDSFFAVLLFCGGGLVEALDDAIGRYGRPEIFNIDQGRQFTSRAWTQRLKEAGVRISMDGRGRFLDNIFIERLWRSLKYECVYLHAWETGSQAKARDRGVAHPASAKTTSQMPDTLPSKREKL